MSSTSQPLDDGSQPPLVDIDTLYFEAACHAPIPDPTLLADPNRVRGARPYTETLYLFFFFKPNLYLWV